MKIHPSTSLVMRLVRMVGTVAVVLFIGDLGWTQPVDSNVQRAFTAHGAAALSGLRTLTLRGQSVIGTTKQPVTISADIATGQIRFDYGTPIVRSLVLTPEGVMEVAGGKASFLPPHVAAFAQFDALGIVELQTLSTLPARYTPTGAGSVKGLTTVKLNANSGRQQIHYRRAVSDSIDVDFDSASGLVVQFARRQYADTSLDLGFICTWTFSNYGTVGGLVLPSVIEKAIDGRLLETITVASAELNAVLPANLFTGIGGRQ